MVYGVAEKVVRSYGLLGHFSTIHKRRYTVGSAGAATNSAQATFLFVWYGYILSLSSSYSLFLSSRTLSSWRLVSSSHLVEAK